MTGYPIAAVRALAAAAALSFLPAAAMAAPVIDLTYDVYLGGIAVMELHTEIALDADPAGAYSIAIAGHTVGLVDRLRPVIFTARSQGVSAGSGELQPEHYETQTTKSSNKIKTVAISFAPGAAPVTRFTPLPDDPIEPTPPALLQGIVDPTSALVALVETLADTGSCEGTIAIFDGRRRYDIAFAERSRDKLAPSKLSMYSGPAKRCRARIVPRHGFDDGDRRAMPEDANVWFARVVPGAPLLPVRIDTDYSITALRIHLVAARLDAPPGRRPGGALAPPRSAAAEPAPVAAAQPQPQP